MADSTLTLIQVAESSGKPIKLVDNLDGTYSLSTTATLSGTVTVSFGTKIDAATMPTGGVGNLGWLSAIWYTLNNAILTALGLCAVPTVQCYSFICDATDELLISNTARKLWGISVNGIGTVASHAKLYDKATAPSEADTPIHRKVLPGESSSLGGGNNEGPWPAYIALTNGLGVRVVTGITDAGDTGVAANTVVVNVYWSV